MRDLVARWRERIVTVATVLFTEGVAVGDLPSGFDVATAARTLANLLDGIVLESLEGNGEVRLGDVERRAWLVFQRDQPSVT